MTVCEKPSLYFGVQGDSFLEIKKCYLPIAIPINCHSSYVYVDQSFIYSIVCPLQNFGNASQRERTRERTERSASRTAQNVSQAAHNVSVNASQNQSNESNRNDFNRSTELQKEQGQWYNNMSNNTRAIRFTNQSNEIHTKDFLDNTNNSIFTVLLISACVLVSMSVLSCAVYLYRKKYRATRVLTRRPSSVMPTVVRDTAKKTSQDGGRRRRLREVRKVLQKIINTICHRHEEDKLPPIVSREPPLPPRRHPRATFNTIDMRKKTLDYLRQQNPIIKEALQKPSAADAFADAGRRRAARIKAEVEEQQKLQQRAKSAKKRRAESRLKNLVRIRELTKK